MDITNTFTVAAPIDRVWNALTDAGRVAPCLPGAQLTGVEGDTYEGTVTVKVGPIRARYRGHARFRELDESARRIVLDAEGREARGQGTAAATVTSDLTAEDDERTRVAVHTDLHLTGKVAQFGGNALSEISGRLLTQFANNLEEQVLAPGPGAAPEPQTRPAQATTNADAQRETSTWHEGREEDLDLLGSAGSVIARRAAPYVAVSALVLLVGWALGRTGRS